jgi:phosphodiesterase/alkaline phosphatase D-like protein
MQKHKACINYLPTALITSSAIGLSLLFPQIVRAGIAYTGIAAGDATSDSVVVWTRTDDTATQHGIATDLTVQLSPDSQFRSRVRSFSGTTDVNHDYTLKLPIKGLKSGTRYYYRFQSSDGTFSPVGTFKTAPDESDRVPVRFGFSGDADGQWRPYASTQNFNQLNLDYFVWLGDTIYESKSNLSPVTADPLANPTQALADYRRKYREQFLPVIAGGFRGLTTFFASQGNYTLLDNHELGNKQFINGGAPVGTPAGAGADATNPANDVNLSGSFINKTPAFQTLVQAYSEYQPIRERTVSAPNDPRANGTQKLYFARAWGANSIFINLDDRSYRDIRMKTAAGADDTSSPRADNPARTMLGTTQLEWFKHVLLDAQKKGTTWKIIAISSPIDQIGVIGNLSAISVTNGGFTTGSDGGKSWIGAYRAERNALLKFIADHHITNVVFLTTDDHQNRVNELTYSPSGKTADQSSYVRVPGNVFEIVAGPIGAGGPDTITDHSFANIKTIADSLAQKENSFGIDPIGLDPNYPGLQNVYREGDPDADRLRQPVDFYTPDTFNYAILDISPNGKLLTVNLYGINSYAANTFPEPSVTGPVRRILGFQVKAHGREHR